MLLVVADMVLVEAASNLLIDFREFDRISETSCPSLASLAPVVTWSMLQDVGNYALMPGMQHNTSYVRFCLVPRVSFFSVAAGGSVPCAVIAWMLSPSSRTVVM